MNAIDGTRRSSLRCRKFWLLTSLALLIVVPLCLLTVLRFGNPQWHKYIFLFQADYWPGDRERMVIPPWDYDFVVKNPMTNRLPSGYTGTWTTWDREGRWYSEDNYYDGIRHGISRRWLGSGSWQRSHYSEATYIHGKAHGPVLSRGEYASTIFLIDGADAVCRVEGQCHSGLREGIWRGYDIEGRKRAEALLVKDRHNGKSTSWHENGQVYVEGCFKDRKPVGVWSYWDKDGKLIKRVDHSKPPNTP